MDHVNGAESILCCSTVFRFRLDVKKFCFSNQVVDNWNCLFVCCVNSNTVNTFKKHVSVELELETVINQRR